MNQDAQIANANNVDVQQSRNLIDTIDKEAKDTTPWFAIRLFGGRSSEVADFFKEKEVESFIPLRMVDFMDKNGKIRQALRPVVRNLLFVKKTITKQAMQELVRTSQYKMSVITRDRQTREYYEIPAKQMFEFRAMCNPEIEMRKYVSAEEARHKVGATVIVSHGPLKGLTGRLVRENRKYFLLKEVPGIGVMLKVTRWCCKVIE